MHILFYEPNEAGHHFAYLARMLPGFTQLPVRVTLATTESAARSKEFAETIGKLAQQPEVAPLCRPLIKNDPAKNAKRRLEDFQTCIAKLQPDHACMVYADGIWQMAAKAALVGRPWPKALTVEGWLFRGGFAYPDARRIHGRATRWLFRRLLRRGLFAKLHMQDELLEAYASRIGGSPTEIALAADPIQLRPAVSQAEARSRLGLQQALKVIACTGTVSRRKGVDLAMMAFRKLPAATQENAQLLIAGPHDEEIKSLLASESFAPLVATGRIVSHDQFLGEDEMLLTAEASDLVLASYPNHSGRSSIILWAAAAGRPVLAVNRGCVQHVVQQNQLGWTTEVVDTDKFAESLHRSLQREWSDSDAERVQQYAAWHRVENYRLMSAALVRKRLEASH